MSKTFHGKVDETIDALIILEACRQGIMPRITRRLLVAERGEIHPPPNATGELFSSASSSYASSTRLSSRAPAPASSTTAALAEPSSLSFATVCLSSSYSSPFSSSSTSSSAATSSSAPASPSSATKTNPSLISPGSVFVFDEEESRICRWTDGKIWSPSRISGNFLVYRELYRKLPHQKCYTTAEKAQMKDGSGLRDRALKEKVEEENLVVMGCMKGTFVLKKGGLVKKTICVKGINLVPPEELKRQLEEPSPALGMSRKGARARGGGGYGGGANGQSRLPGFSTRGIQHLVCYEMPGEMENLHGPREYLELRDLPISKTFVMMQSYRVPLQILPLDCGQQPLDPADEYIHSSRVVESRPTRPTPPSFFNTASEKPVNKRPRTRGGRQRKSIEEEEEEASEREGEPDYLVKNIYGGSCGSAFYGSSITTASQPFLPSLPAIAPTPLPSAAVPVYHGYSTRGQNRYIREQNRQQQQHLESWTPSPSMDSTTVKGKKRKRPLSRSLAMEADHTLAVKVEKPSPSMEYSYLASRTTASDLFFQQNIMGADDAEMGGDHHRPPSGRPTSPLATRSTPAQMPEFLQSMHSKPLDDIELKVHGYKTAEGEWRLGTPSMSTTTGSVNNDHLAHARSANRYNGGSGPPMSWYPYQDGPHWQQDPGYSRHQYQQHSPWDHGSYYQMDARKTCPGQYPAQQHILPYYDPQPQFQTSDDLQYQTPELQALSNSSTPYYDTAQASTATLPPIHDVQGSYGYHAGEYRQPLSIGSTMHSAATSEVSQNGGDLEMEHSDKAGYKTVHQSMSHTERVDSPWSSGSAYSRSSSLSTSLTLSPVKRSQASVGQDSGSTAELECGFQSSTEAAIANGRRDVGGVHSSTDSQLPYSDEPTTDQIVVQEQEGDTATAAFPNHQGHRVSVSFMYTARSSALHLAVSQAPSQVSAISTIPALTPGPGRRDDSSVSLASSTHMANSSHQDSHQISSPSQKNPQPKGQPFQTSVHPFRRDSQQPYVPIMSFSSGTILGTSPLESRQGSPTTQQERILDSAVAGSEIKDSLTYPEYGAVKLSNRDQEEVATDEIGNDDGPFVRRMQASPSPETSNLTPSEDPSTIEAATSATMAVSPVQTYYCATAAGPLVAVATGSTLLLRQSGYGTYSSQPGPYSPQPRRDHMNSPSFMFHDLDDRDEFDRLLEYHSHQVEMLEKHDHVEQGAAMGGPEHGSGEHFRGTGEYDDGEVSEQTFQQLTQPPIHARTEDESQSSGRSQMMSPGTLSALHHYSNKGFSQGDGIRGDSAGSVGPAAPSLGMVSSSGSLGQDEYLLHQARPLITKMHLRRYGHKPGAGTGVGIGTSLEVARFGSSEGFGYMSESGGSSSNGELKSGGPGSGAGACRSEDFLGALGRHDDASSSEIACQLFSGLDALRGGGAGGGESRVNASGMGVGIGTSIGIHRRGSVIRLVGCSDQGSGCSEREVVRGRTQSVQTLQLSGPVDQYSFKESSSRSASPPGLREEYEEQGDEEGEAGYDPQYHHQLMFQRGGGCVVNKVNDTFIEREDVEEEEEEEEEEVDELEVLDLYSGQSSDGTSSPVQEPYYDDDGDEDQEIGQEYRDQDQVQEGDDIGLVTMADQVNN
ncbi:hypothetical protein BGZ97_012653 [Linnemannia gamsii]|uniref:Uncharacterized protein n=1 Tax=Linnemannia gamsii TaxID=64522 RepID=A0A9P6R3C8_9FUNG|nr:hypothetical protein BGZ97_012653 [Linnemannia gamsii]